jgi:hypothetical protein
MKNQDFISYVDAESSFASRTHSSSSRSRAELRRAPRQSLLRPPRLPRRSSPHSSHLPRRGPAASAPMELAAPTASAPTSSHRPSSSPAAAPQIPVVRKQGIEGMVGSPAPFATSMVGGTGSWARTPSSILVGATASRRRPCASSAGSTLPVCFSSGQTEEKGP